jgi:hypothetical protein
MTITGITSITAIGMANEVTGVTIITDMSSSALGRLLSKRAINSKVREYRPPGVFDFAPNFAACQVGIGCEPTVSDHSRQELETAVKRGDGSPLIFDSVTVLDRVEQQGDLFAPVPTLKQRAEPPIDRLK